MKKYLLVLLSVVFVFSAGVYAEDFSKVAKGDAEIIQKGDGGEWCPICGMNLRQYYKTNHAVILKDGSARQYCSVRCLAVDYPNIQKQVKQILVADAKHDKLIDVKKAFYVMGSTVQGTMTNVSKIAFSTMTDAEEFKKMYGGEIANFEKVFAAAKDSLKDDIDMTNKRKQTQVYPVGEKIFTKMCIPDIEPTRYGKISEMKYDIVKNKLCKSLEEKQLQAVALYLWEVKRLQTRAGVKPVDIIDVPKDAKCPVCGMFVYKYPKWAAKLTYSQSGKENHLYFDGVKDLVKFYMAPERWGNYKGVKIDRIIVSDYYTQKGIDGKAAYYVVGSNILGPMGNELIPFVDEASAKSFSVDHGGKKIVKFTEITSEMLSLLDK